MPSEKLKVPTICTEVFGGVLEYDGNGYYPGLELLNLVWCAKDGVLPRGEGVAITRRAHDFARTLVWDEQFGQNPAREQVLMDEGTEHAVRGLLQCLQLPIPGVSKPPTWERAHFFPYSDALVHWDARRSRRSARDGPAPAQIERRYLRGGGALAFKVLRMDPDEKRLHCVREGFERLDPKGSRSALDQIMLVLGAKGARDTEPRVDEIEKERSRVEDDVTDDLLRDGVARILGHTELSAAVRVRALMRWTAFWLLVVQQRRSAAFLHQPEVSVICDCAGSRQQLRRAARKSLKDMLAMIAEAVARVVKRNSHKEPPSRSKLRAVASFYSATAATLKLLNARTGRRHFTIGLDLLETLVLAATNGKHERTFEWFVVDWLFGKCGLVVGRVAAERAGLLSSFDASLFEDNEQAVVRDMAAIGLLTEYSDATRMVGTRGLA